MTSDTGNEILEGGVANADAVQRDGDVVHRPAPPCAPALHAFLRAIRAEGFAGVPEPLSLDRDRETLGYLPGDVALPPFPAWAMSEEALTSVARLVRRYHDTARTVGVPGDAPWPSELSDPRGGTMLCHNDICVENTVFRHGKAVALLDFDLAAPGRPLWDLAHVSRFWAPMLDPESAAIAYPAGLDPARRLRMLADAYGLPLGDRVALVDAIRAADEAARAFVAARVQRGERAFLEAFTQQGGWVRWDRKITWFEATSNRLIGELLA